MFHGGKEVAVKDLMAPWKDFHIILAVCLGCSFGF